MRKRNKREKKERKKKREESGEGREEKIFDSLPPPPLSSSSSSLSPSSFLLQIRSTFEACTSGFALVSASRPIPFQSKEHSWSSARRCDAQNS